MILQMGERFILYLYLGRVADLLGQLETQNHAARGSDGVEQHSRIGGLHSLLLFCVQLRAAQLVEVIVRPECLMKDYLRDLPMIYYIWTQRRLFYVELGSDLSFVFPFAVLLDYADLFRHLALIGLRQQPDLPYRYRGCHPTHGLPLILLLNTLQILLLLQIVLHGDSFGNAKPCGHHLLVLIPQEREILLIL